jgi:hypothetical protein
MSEKEAKQKLKDGWIHVLVTFQIVGKPAKHVDESLKAFLEAIKKDERIYWLEQHVDKAQKTEDSKDNEEFFSAFAEVDLLVQNLETLNWLCVNYMPATVEVIEPHDFELSGLDVQNWVGDVLARLHQISAAYKQQTAEVDFLKSNFNTLMRNVILLSLAKGPKKLSELVKDTTLVEKVTEAHLKKLLTEGKVVEKKGVYHLK